MVPHSPSVQSERLNRFGAYGMRDNMVEEEGTEEGASPPEGPHKGGVEEDDEYGGDTKEDEDYNCKDSSNDVKSPQQSPSSSQCFSQRSSDSKDSSEGEEEPLLLQPERNRSLLGEPVETEHSCELRDKLEQMAPEENRLEGESGTEAMEAALSKSVLTVSNLKPV